MNGFGLKRIILALIAVLSMTFDFSGNARCGESWGINLKLMGGPLSFWFNEALRVAPLPRPGVHTALNAVD
jgi:hypothetical protein